VPALAWQQRGGGYAVGPEMRRRDLVHINIFMLPDQGNRTYCFAQYGIDLSKKNKVSKMN